MTMLPIGETLILTTKTALKHREYWWGHIVKGSDEIMKCNPGSPV